MGLPAPAIDPMSSRFVVSPSLSFVKHHHFTSAINFSCSFIPREQRIPLHFLYTFQNLHRDLAGLDTSSFIAQPFSNSNISIPFQHHLSINRYVGISSINSSSYHPDPHRYAGISPLNSSSHHPHPRHHRRRRPQLALLTNNDHDHVRNGLVRCRSLPDSSHRNSQHSRRHVETQAIARGYRAGNQT